MPRPTDHQREQLCKMLMAVFVEIRADGWNGRIEPMTELADAFHNLPVDMYQDYFDWASLKLYLDRYRKRFPRGTDYGAWLAAIEKGP
jgi:hypothetical protein